MNVKDRTVLLIATMDTKGREALFASSCLEEAGVRVLILDAGIRGRCDHPVAVSREEVARAAGRTLSEIQALSHEGEALSCMLQGALCRAQELRLQGEIRGILGLGGSMGTTLATGVMRSFPVGFPKVMISTMASRDTRPFVGTRDILMLHSVCDLAGLNRITRRVLRNGALALAGMVLAEEAPADADRPLVGITTLGTTEACALQVREGLESKDFEAVTFHTVGAGGEAMEEMVREGTIKALVDLSLHELMDHRFGGDYDAGPERGKAALQKGIPTVLVPGNIDFLVTGPLARAAERFPRRQRHAHNAAITVVRSRPEEIREAARVLAGFCNATQGPAAILIPLQGLSAFDREGAPLHDPRGPALFRDTLQEALTRPLAIRALPCHVNDPAFADALLETILGLMGAQKP